MPVSKLMASCTSPRWQSGVRVFGNTAIPGSLPSTPDSHRGLVGTRPYSEGDQIGVGGTVPAGRVWAPGRRSKTSAIALRDSFRQTYRPSRNISS